MPNFYIGKVIISGDISKFTEWYKKKILTNFANTFVPLKDKNDCYLKWGVNFELSNIKIIKTNEINEFSFSFLCHWNSPIYLWKNIEEMYNVNIEEYGYEEQKYRFDKYKNGKMFEFYCCDWLKKEYNFEVDEYNKNEYNKNEYNKNEYNKFIEWKNIIWNEALEKWNSTYLDDKIIWQKVSLPK
jgi:hypothetical protein